MEGHKRIKYATIGISAIILLIILAHTSDRSSPSGFLPKQLLTYTSSSFHIGGDENAVYKPKTTQERVETANRLYEKFLGKRKDLIKMLGPDPHDIPTFPGTEFDPKHRLYMLWDFFSPSWPCPHEVERVGIGGDGGKWCCGIDRVLSIPNCTIYSFGVEQRSSFEAELLERSESCKLYAYDQALVNIGQDIQNNPKLKRRSTFRQYQLDAVDLPRSPLNAETHTLGYIMRENDHSFIDLLKIDVEGNEFDLMKTIVRSAKGKPLPFAQLQLEIHGWDYSFPEWLEWFEMLEKAGLRPFYRELNYQDAKTRGSPEVIEYSFINIRSPSNYPLLNDMI